MNVARTGKTVAPDVRSRSYRIEADVAIPASGGEGVLIARGDATCGYSFYVRDGRLVHDMNVGGTHVVVRSDRPAPPGRHVLGAAHGAGRRAAHRHADDRRRPGGQRRDRARLRQLHDRMSPVSDYAAPFPFTGTLHRVTVTMDGDQSLDGDGIGRAETARQ